MFGFLWRSSWLIFLAAIAAGIASGLSSASLIALINSALSGHFEQATLLWKFAGLCAMVLLSASSSFYLINRLSEKATYELRLQISRLILAAPYPYLQKLGRPALLANLTEDIVAIAGAYQLLPVLCINTAVVSGCMAYLGWLSWQLALILGGIILFGVLSFIVLKEKPKKSMERARAEYDNLNRSFRALTEGIKELKLHSARSGDFMEHSLAASAESYRRHSLSGLTFYMLSSQWVNLLYYATIGLILCVFPLWQHLSQDVIRGYTLVFLFMMSPLSVLTNSLPVFGRAGIALRQVEKLGASLRLQIQQADRVKQPERWSTFHSLSLQNLTHSFHREKENRNFTLGPVNLEFKPGELVFLVGGNGSGKTTLAMLLIGLYSPEQGVIRLNGETVTDENRAAYLQNFSVVFSDFYLFDDLFGFNADKVNAQAIDFLERLHLSHKVSIDNGKFSTLDLSQGQRKRLALLVAYLEDRPFYVFDEWAADQDPEFKELFYTELLPALKANRKTVLAITHDDRYFHLADRCIKLEEGQIKTIDYPAVNLKTDARVWDVA
ncbi:MAG: cyclic peptide export ABC transporter [Methylovulum sp.]|nr:cyclic peptide export ABC transporter [Methylovulum sp.]